MDPSGSAFVKVLLCSRTQSSRFPTTDVSFKCLGTPFEGYSCTCV